MSRETNAASRFRSLLASERRSADLYSGLADATTGERREVLSELAAVERKHAAHWAGKLGELGEPVPPAEPAGLRTSALSWLARRFSIDAVLPYLERAEHADAGLYQGDPNATAAMAVDERSHARVLTRLRTTDDPSGIRKVERWHRGDRSRRLAGRGVRRQRRPGVQQLACDGFRGFRCGQHHHRVRRACRFADRRVFDGGRGPVRRRSDDRPAQRPRRAAVRYTPAADRRGCRPAGLRDRTPGRRFRWWHAMTHRALRSSGSSRPSRACATAVALPENDWLH
jgi:hypothetical protein